MIEMFVMGMLFWFIYQVSFGADSGDKSSNRSNNNNSNNNSNSRH